MPIRSSNRSRHGGASPARPALRTRRQRRLSVEQLDSRVLLTGGAWTKLASPFPNGDGGETMLLLSDGSVMITGGEGQDSANWYKLTPDSTGSYVNGTFSQLASMGTARLFYSSDVLPDGRVYVAGGEYSDPNSDNNDANTGEIYDPVANTWTPIPNFPEPNLGDAESETIRNGLIFESSPFDGNTYIFNPNSNTWTQGPSLLDGDIGAEEGWAKLGDGSTLQYDISGASSPAANRLVLGATDAQDQWVSAGTLPVQLDSNGGNNGIVPELGPGFLLPDGRVFWVGASNQTALYTPPTPGNPTGTWVAGPTQSDANGNPIGAFDAPGAVEPNGDVLWAASAVDGNTFAGPTTFLEYDPSTNAISRVTSPGPDLTSGAFTSRMLVLPSGQIMFDTGVDSDLWVYTPSSAPNPAWAPTITSIVKNGSNSFTLTGTQLTGLDEGAAYGDDAQMATDYPIVRLTEAGGKVIFARTTDWSSTWVATGNTPETVNFTLPAGAGNGPFTLNVVTNGIASAPVPFSTAVDVTATAPSNVVETVPFTAQVASFTDSNALPASDYTATINWGDGTPTTTGVVQVVGSGNYIVTAGHTYALGGPYTMQVNVTDNALQDSGSGSALVNVGALPLIATPVAVNGFEGNPVSSLVATFTDTFPGVRTASDYSATISWGDGTTTAGTITPDPLAGFDVSGAKTYGDEGQYAIQVQIHGPGGAVALVTTGATVADAPLSSNADAIAPVVGAAFSGAVAHFVDANPVAPLSDFTVSIDWGDGVTSLGGVAASAGGGFDATGTHTYHVAGPYTVNVFIKDVGGSSTSTTEAVTVSDAAISVALGTLGSQEGSLFSGVVANFTDANPFAVLSQFSGVVVWGDGQTTAGTVQVNGAGGFDVAAAHTYITAGSYPIDVEVTSTGGSTASASGQFVVQDAPLIVGPTSVSAVAGVSFSGLVASFSDTDPTLRPTSHYSATITWGDGTTSAGTIVSVAGNAFSVDGTHQYAGVGTDSVLVKVSDAQGSSGTITDTAVVVDAPINPTSVSISAVAGASFNGTIATFTDANFGAPASYFSAAVTWGDGIKSSATVVSLGGGNFTVQGTHVYAVPDTYVTNVQISDAGGASASASGTANVADAPLFSSPVSLTLTEGSTFSGIIANFTDANIFAIAGEFTAQINWGDGASTTGNVVGDGQGAFSVDGTHVYINPGNFVVHVSVLHNAGSSTAVDSSVLVVPATITGSSPSINTTAGSSAPVEVATFLDSDPTPRSAAQYSATISWGDGAVTAGTVQADPSGGFDVFGVHAYQFGVYPFTVSIQKSGGGGVQTSGTATVADATMTAGAPIVLSGGEGTPFNGLVGSFTDGNPGATTSSFLATIQWGDGASSAGTITSLPGNQFGVSGNHVYGAGNYVTSVVVTDLAGKTLTLQGSARVTDVPLTASGVAVSAVEGATFQGVVATFTDADPRTNPPSNYSATINWGDGLTTAGTIAFDSNNHQYTVSGVHQFRAGSFTILTTINDQGGSTTTTTSPATISDAPLSASPAATTIAPTEGVPFSGQVATFTDADPRPNPPGNYSATITWGDHTTTLGIVTSTGAGQYSVSGTHTYSAGQYTIGVAIRDIGGSITTLSEPVTVADAPLTATAGVTIAMQEGVPFSGLVAHFTDADPRVLTSSNYTATVNWGDGTTSAGAVVANPSGGYDVVSGHTYPNVGSNTVVVTIKDVGGSMTTASSTAEVADAPLTGTPGSLQATSQSPATGVVGSFSSADRSSLASNFTATIAWGDGTGTPGVVQALGNGAFNVLGTHVYTEGGSYLVTWTVSDVGGSTTGGSETVTVADKLYAITAGLDPSSDSGQSSSDGITNDTTPKINGTAEPNATVNVYVTRAPIFAPVSIGATKADASGHWSITSFPLIDGDYSLYASATDAFGRPSTPFTQIAFGGTQGSLVIDTQGPRVAGLTLVPQASAFLITFQDDLGGLNQASLANGLNYSLSMPFVKGDPTYVSTAVVTAPGATATSPELVAVRFNTPAKLKAGSYVLTISAAGIVDAAGNPLVEQFFIPSPTQGYRPGQNYVAQINYNGKSATAPQQYISPAELAAAAQQRKLAERIRAIAIRKRH